jgi:hypothetical protein
MNLEQTHSSNSHVQIRQVEDRISVGNCFNDLLVFCFAISRDQHSNNLRENYKKYKDYVCILKCEMLLVDMQGIRFTKSQSDRLCLY